MEGADLEAGKDGELHSEFISELASEKWFRHVQEKMWGPHHIHQVFLHQKLNAAYLKNPLLRHQLQIGRRFCWLLNLPPNITGPLVLFSKKIWTGKKNEGKNVPPLETKGSRYPNWQKSGSSPALHSHSRRRGPRPACPPPPPDSSLAFQQRSDRKSFRTTSHS